MSSMIRKIRRAIIRRDVKYRRWTGSKEKAFRTRLAWTAASNRKASPQVMLALLGAVATMFGRKIIPRKEG